MALAVLGSVPAALTLVPPWLSSATPSGATSTFKFTRFAGDNRYATAAQVAAHDFSSGAATVLLARDEPGGPSADALGGTYVAGRQGNGSGAPILLTDPNTLPAETSGALKSLAAKTVVIMGGTSAVSQPVEDSLKSAGYTTSRIAGANRYDTAAQAAQNPGPLMVGLLATKRTAILANGEGLNSPDALSAGPAAFAGSLPVLLTQQATLPPETSAALKALNIQQVVIVGGTAVVAPSVEDGLKTAGYSTLRIAGVNRSDTAVQIAKQLEYPSLPNGLGFAATHVNLARGDDSADALSGGPHGGKEKAANLVTLGACDYDAATTGAFLSANSSTLTDGHVLGGSGAVCDTVVQQAQHDAATASSGTTTTTSPLGALSSTTSSTAPGGSSTSSSATTSSTLLPITTPHS